MAGEAILFITGELRRHWINGRPASHFFKGLARNHRRPSHGWKLVSRLFNDERVGNGKSLYFDGAISCQELAHKRPSWQSINFSCPQRRHGNGAFSRDKEGRAYWADANVQAILFAGSEEAAANKSRR